MPRHSYIPDASGLPGFQMSEIHYIPINRLKKPYQSDEATNEAKVMENVRKMKEGEPLPPCVIGLDHDLLDGHHRVEAAERMGYTHVPCVVGIIGDVARYMANARYRKLWNSDNQKLEKSEPVLVLDANKVQFIDLEKGYNPAEPRDWHGRWTKGGGTALDKLKGDKYVNNFVSVVQAYHGKKFHDIVSAEAKAEGDNLLMSGETGYNVTKYEVGHSGDVLSAFTSNHPTINYSMYTDHTDHGVKLMRALRDEGLQIPYKIHVKASSVLWDDSWDQEPEAQYEKVNGKTVARTAEYVISFYPQDDKQAQRLFELLNTKANKGYDEENAIEKSWYVPDIRASKSVPGMEPRTLNAKRVGNNDLMVLTKGRALKGFEAHQVWLNPGLAEFIKSFATAGLIMEVPATSIFRVEDL